jgi:hypothetical protein
MVLSTHAEGVELGKYTQGLDSAGQVDLSGVGDNTCPK